jgi:hypothetical protein
MRKDPCVNVVIAHHMIPFYNPAIRDHVVNNWDPNQRCMWDVQIRRGLDVKKHFFVSAFYEQIEDLMCYLVK